MFLRELLKLLSYADMYFKQREFIGFYNAGLVITFMTIAVGQHKLADKIYSMFGQMLLTAKKYGLALEMYSKLRNCAHTHRDVISKMYALR